MRLEKNEKGKCEMGGCKNKSGWSIRMDRAGIKSRIDVCDSCLMRLYRLIGETLIPKSIETVKKRNDDGGQ